MEKNQVWKAILAEIELSVSKPTFNTLFAKTSLSSLKDHVATVACPNPIIQEMVETRYYSLLKNVLDKHTKKGNSLVFIVQKDATQKEKRRFGPLFTVSEKEKVFGKVRELRLHPDFTFANFAVSSSNQLAYAAATAVTKSPGKAYNPLFLYGGVGVGKTHLAQAIAHSFLEKKPGMRIIYCTGEEFTNEIIEAIRRKTTAEFKRKYRKVNALLLDDVQFIAGKTTVQEEFFHTFNAIRRGGGQIILTSDRPPDEISKLEERLRSRFEEGLTIDITQPDFELRTAILLIKAKQRGIDLPIEVAKLISANITSTRRLEGTLVRLISESEVKKEPVSLELAQFVLGKTTRKKEVKKKVSPKEVMKVVASYFGLKHSQLKGVKRDRPIVRPRQILMYLLRTELNLLLLQIGEILGGRDHTTIMHGTKKITKELLKNEALREDILRIKNKIWGKN